MTNADKIDILCELMEQGILTIKDAFKILNGDQNPFDSNYVYPLDVEIPTLFPPDDVPEFESNQILPYNQKDQWKKEGRCPTCGEKGAFVNFQMTCSKHGTY